MRRYPRVLILSSRSPHSTSRGQSSVIGVVMVVAITVLGVTGILFFGSTAILQAQGQSEIGAAEHAMTQLDSQFSLVALGSTERQSATVDVRGDATMRVDGDRGWMNVSIINRTSGEVNETILNTTLGAIVYEKDGTSIAYQGGGVWKRTPSGGSVMVSPPEFHYRKSSGTDPTLTLPLVTVRGNATTPGEVSVEKAETEAKYPDPDDSDRSNPLTGGEINVTVHSEYYEAWGAFFEERTGGDVAYDHQAETVTIALRISSNAGPLQGGLVSSAAGTTLDFHNHAEADSYNSSEGNYTQTEAHNTSVVVAGDFELGNQATLWGDLVAGGSVTTDTNSEITGNVTYGGTEDIDGTVGGTIESGADVEDPDAADWLIDDQREAFEDPDNDNGAASDVDDSSDELVNCASQCTLPAGDYYLDDIDIDSGDNLQLDTSSGDVNVVVDGDVDFGDSTVNVTGDGVAKFYIEGEMDVGGSGNVSVPDQNSTQLWFYVNPGTSVEFGNGARFVGVVYGPGNGAQSGASFSFNNHLTLYGGLVGDVPFVNNHMDVHFDEALTNKDPLAGFRDDQPTVTYLHVTVNRVNASAG